MVNYCCVTGCGRRSKGSHLFFHAFPKDTNRQEIWCHAIGRQDIMEKPPEKRLLYRVCSKHFDASSVKNKHLSATAVPTLNLTGSEKRDETVNVKLSCNNCSASIVGFRYKCISCENYDLCSRCEMLEVHAEHYMLRIPAPATFVEVSNIFKRIKQSSKDDSGCSSDDEPITKYKTDNLDLSEDVKQKIRNEVNRVFKVQRKGKRKAVGDRKSKSQRVESFSSEVVFADVNEWPMSVDNTVEVKSENIYESLEEPSMPLVNLKLTDDLNEILIESTNHNV